MPTGGRMKGQFFIIGALLICSLLYIGLAPTISVTVADSADMGRLAENMESELPHALNIGAVSPGVPGALMGFSNFSADAAHGRGISMKCLWVAIEPGQGSVNVTVGNLMGAEETVGIDVDGTYMAVRVPDGAFNYTELPVSGPSFTVNITHADGGTAAEMPSNKTSLYAFLQLSRGGDVTRKEILA